MLKHYFKVCFKMTLAHVTVQVFSLALGPLIFYIILGTQLGWYVMSAVLSIAYAMWIYSTAYKIADKDIKSYSAHKPYLAKGLVLSIPTLLITLVLTLLYDFSFYHTFADYNTRMWVELIVRNLFYGWNFAFEGFRSAADGTVSLLYWVLCFGMMPLFSFLGYWAGMNRYEFGYQFFSRLVYKVCSSLPMAIILERFWYWLCLRNIRRGESGASCFSLQKTIRRRCCTLARSRAWRRFMKKWL